MTHADEDLDATYYEEDKKYLITLTKALLHFGAPTNRIESYLRLIAKQLGIAGQFIPLPGKIVVNIKDFNTDEEEHEVVESDGHCSLSAIEMVHEIAHEVYKSSILPKDGTRKLKQLMHARPIYRLFLRCLFAFFCSACFSILEFGGSLVDMPVAGVCSAFLLFIKVKMSGHEEDSVEVYEIPMVFVLSFVARALSTMQDGVFCYSAISSAAIVFILPGYTVLISALELTNGALMVGSLRMVYALIYTLMLGFALTMGSELYLTINTSARQSMSHVIGKIAHPRNVTAEWMGVHGRTAAVNMILMNSAETSEYVIEGCFRDPFWPWWRQPLHMLVQEAPWNWIVASGIAIALSASKSLAHLQSWRSSQFLGMILISYATWDVTVYVKESLNAMPFLVSTFGGATVGAAACVWGKAHQSDIFTVSVTGVLFLVPVALSEGDSGLEAASAQNGGRHPGATLAVRMLQVVWGVAFGLHLGQSVILHPIGWLRKWQLKKAGKAEKKTFMHRNRF